MKKVLGVLLLLIVLIIIIQQPYLMEKNIFSVSEKINQTISSMQPVTLDPHAKTLGGSISSPLYNQTVVDGDFVISGSIKRHEAMNLGYVWIMIQYTGKNALNLPTSCNYYVPILKGSFSKKICLFCGEGKYRVNVRVPSHEKKNMYYPFASFEIRNKSASIRRDISYSALAEEMGLQIITPSIGYLCESEVVHVKGRFMKQSTKQNILIQVRKGKKNWQKVTSCVSKKFDEAIPLLFGEGIHEIQLLIPHKTRKNHYLEGAVFYVKNQSQKILKPIRYTHLYEERGIQLHSPLAGRTYTEHCFHLSGKINPGARHAKKTSYLITRIRKGENQATYFVPVSRYSFHEDIWLRFGSGLYTVEVLVPEITQKKQDFFRYYSVATLEVKGKGLKDLRNLLPSRGIQSKNPDIIRLAHQLTKENSREIEKAKAVYMFVSKNMVYDVQKVKHSLFSYDDSALKALKTKKGVCQDYVFLTLSLLRSLEIPSRFIEGYAGGESHAWVESYLNNRWVTMDPTWGSGYIYRDKFVKKYDPVYFDPPPSQFGKTHKRLRVIY